MRQVRSFGNLSGFLASSSRPLSISENPEDCQDEQSCPGSTAAATSEKGRSVETEGPRTSSSADATQSKSVQDLTPRSSPRRSWSPWHRHKPSPLDSLSPSLRADPRPMSRRKSEPAVLWQLGVEDESLYQSALTSPTVSIREETDSFPPSYPTSPNQSSWETTSYSSYAAKDEDESLPTTPSQGSWETTSYSSYAAKDQEDGWESGGSAQCGIAGPNGGPDTCIRNVSRKLEDGNPCSMSDISKDLNYQESEFVSICAEAVQKHIRIDNSETGRHTFGVTWGNMVQEPGPPTIARVQGFLWYVTRQLNLEEEILIVAMVFLDQIARCGDGTLDPCEWRPLSLTCLLLACKTHHDSKFYTSDTVCYLPKWQLDVGVLQQNELRVLLLLDFRIFVSPVVFHQYERGLREKYTGRNVSSYIG